MDWGRAKTILILSFFFLNIMLGYELWENKWNLGKSNAEAAIALEELNRFMKSKNIGVNTEIPKEVPKLREIMVTSVEQLRQNEPRPFETPVKQSRFIGKTILKDPIATLINKSEAYQADLAAGSEGVIVLNQMYGPFPIFDVNLELFYQNGEVTSYKQDYVEVESGDQKEQKVIPAHMAIRTLVENYLLAGSVIKEIRLGYHGRFFYSEKQLLLPSWRVAVANGEFYYVNAFNGAVEVPQKMKKAENR